MCEFCDNLIEKTILDYDNHDSMNIDFGQYKGVHVYSNLNMKGNMLILNGGGSYRSSFDCYYEAEGLDDCDGETARKSKCSYVQIKYCPFCGKEIKSVLYEKTKTNDEIIELKNKLKELKKDLDYSNMFINFEWSINKRTPEEIDKIVEEHRKEVEAHGWKFTNVESYVESIQYYGYIENYSDNPSIKREYQKSMVSKVHTGKLLQCWA